MKPNADSEVSAMRSSIAPENYQEMIDASKHTSKTMMLGQNQYETPREFARFLSKLLPGPWSWIVFDPQCAKGNLLSGMSTTTVRYGFEIDNRMANLPDGIRRVTGNCVKVYGIMDELFPELRFDCQVANPPFGNTWLTADGRGSVDSTEFTWQQLMRRCPTNGYGFFIANAETIERLGIDKHKWVYLYQKFPGSVLWKNVDVEIGVVHFHNCDSRPLRAIRAWDDISTQSIMDGSPVYDARCLIEKLKEYYQLNPFTRSNVVAPERITQAFLKMQDIINEEKADRPQFNIYLDKHGMLRTYLSMRFTLKHKLTPKEVERLSRINKSHPLTLTTDRHTRDLMNQVIEGGIYTIQPEARAAIDAALREMQTLSCPIMPVTKFESVAYADEEDMLLCVKNWGKRRNGQPQFKAGVKYRIETNVYKFTEKFTRRKPHHDESRNRMYIETHQCTLSGQDRYIQIHDESDHPQRFMERPQNNEGKLGMPADHLESVLWEIFQMPSVMTVAESNPEAVQRNINGLELLEMLGDFTYYPGQKNYLGRVGVKDYGLVGGATGTGKSLMAISLIQLKAAKRALIIAPQGTTRMSDDEDGEEEFGASQWVNEIRTFACGRAVFELFSHDDYVKIKAANNGQLPVGIYITYYQAMFQNGARESIPDAWDDIRTVEEIRRLTNIIDYKLPPAPPEAKDPERYWCETIGEERNGIRCILMPCLATLIGHEFDMVCLDEAHTCANLDANVTQMLIRLQPKFRYAFTATPIFNVISNLFSVMGWLCVPGWYKGEMRNAAWPYSRAELHKFISTFQSTERDLTQEDRNKEAAEAAGKVYRGKCERVSPVISSPARLLKIIKPTLAYIGKKDCRPELPDANVIDIRVPMGLEQMKLYAHFLNRGNIPAKSSLEAARKQGGYLRYILADPQGAHQRYGGPKVTSSMNPKTIAVMELTREIINKGQQVVIIAARKGQNSYYEMLIKSAGIETCRIDSTVDASLHSLMANKFKAGDAQVLFMGIKCAAAHSFSRCPNAIITSLEYTPGSLEQAGGRVDRVNSLITPVNIWCVLHSASYEETMFDTVATKDDAAKICLRGQRVPRNFKPVDMSEVLAETILNFKNAGEGVPETLCAAKWPLIRKGFL